MDKPAPDVLPDRGLPTPARLARALDGALPPRGRAIGLLGGSFNPAHAGHVHISRQALKRLNLHEVWWLVSPQNPLKAKDGMAPLAERLRKARLLTRHQRIRVTALEALFGTQLTAESLGCLLRRLPERRFVWLMGADNMIQVVRWHHWTKIFNQLPVAVLARPSYSIRASSSKAAIRFRKGRLTGSRARQLALSPPPAWALLRIRLNKLSATGLRRARPGQTV